MLDMLAGKAFSSRNKKRMNADQRESSPEEDRGDFCGAGEVGVESPQGSKEMGAVPQELERPTSGLQHLQAQYRALLEKIEKLNPELASLVTVNPLRAMRSKSP